LLEALSTAGSTEDDEWTTGEQMVLVPLQGAPALASSLPEADGAGQTLEQ
jgi:hypothetical protein